MSASGAVTPRDAAIRLIYTQVQAPDWAASNLDALTDVLRDLSWLPPGPVAIALPDLAGLPEPERQALLRTIARAVDDSLDSDRPLRVTGAR